MKTNAHTHTHTNARGAAKHRQQGKAYSMEQHGAAAH